MAPTGKCILLSLYLIHGIKIVKITTYQPVTIINDVCSFLFIYMYELTKPTFKKSKKYFSVAPELYLFH